MGVSAVFIVATCTDFIDGAMARKRDQITVLGTYIDPMADKLLVAAVLAFVGHGLPRGRRLMLVFIVLELVAHRGGRAASCSGRAAPARPTCTARSKMVFQSIALYVFLLGGILGLQDAG